jgi:hypothetical protein
MIAEAMNVPRNMVKSMIVMMTVGAFSINFPPLPPALTISVVTARNAIRNKIAK